MILIKNFFLVVVGLSSGIIVAGAVFAFITLLGVINRLASRTSTAKYMSIYEDMVTLGGTIGNIIIIFEFKVPITSVGMALLGLFSGVFVGCQIMALAEVLKVIPVFVTRVKLTLGIPIIVLSIALGKACGAFYQLFVKAG
ncbi:MAG TPA: stage V sporulation protein AB [Lachnospiraceae bacterium]|nr:stage V sporulation protein AB [Lachnospiraceae bacterium]